MLFNNSREFNTLVTYYLTSIPTYQRISKLYTYSSTDTISLTKILGLPDENSRRLSTVYYENSTDDNYQNFAAVTKHAMLNLAVQCFTFYENNVKR